ncbi:MAG: hypothetical protein ACTSP1_11425 [Candidatus Freyarchaeota archaeon]
MKTYLKIDEVDSFLEFLAKEFGVEKPNYQIYKLVLVKKLDPVKTRLSGSLRIKNDPIPPRAWFDRMGKIPYLTFLFRSTRGISKKVVLHEFIHYIHYLKEGEKVFENIEEEERRTIRETKLFWDKLKNSH